MRVVPDASTDSHSPVRAAGFSAVLLAGGRSSRMGRDKAGVLWNGQPLWEWQLAKLRLLEPDALWISGRTDGPYAIAGVEIVADRTPGCGPLSGLEAALLRSAHPFVAVLAIDLPAMTPEFLRTLVREAGNCGKGVVPRLEGWFEPLAAIYPRECLGLIQERLQGTDLSMQKFVAEAVEAGLVVVRDVAPEDTALFQNVNTPEDLPAS